MDKHQAPERLIDPYSVSPYTTDINRLRDKHNDPTGNFAVVVDNKLIAARTNELSHAKKIRKEILKYHLAMSGKEIVVSIHTIQDL